MSELDNAERWLRGEVHDTGRDFNAEGLVLAELDRLRARVTELDEAAVSAAELADAVEDYVFTKETDLSRLRVTWQAYVEAVDPA